MKKKKLYLVKREVTASNIREAMTKGGPIYCIEESTVEPEKITPPGFNVDKKKKKK